jgi:hypothetical protein
MVDIGLVKQVRHGRRERDVSRLSQTRDFGEGGTTTKLDYLGDDGSTFSCCEYDPSTRLRSTEVGCARIHAASAQQVI